MYADTDLYEMVKFHREKDRGSATPQGFHPYTLKCVLAFLSALMPHTNTPS